MIGSIGRCARPAASGRAGHGRGATEEVDQQLLSLYAERRTELARWLRLVRAAIESAPPDVRGAIHVIRTRMKDSERLRQKIARKRREAIERGEQPPSASDFFERFRDLAGLRVLTLSTADYAAVDRFIQTSRSWRVVDAIPYRYRAGSNRVVDPAGLARAVAGPTPHTSIDYVVSPNPEKSRLRADLCCQVQMRTLPLEVWAELDHELRYPDQNPPPAVRTLLASLYASVAVTEEIVRALREAAAEGQ